MFWLQNLARSRVKVFNSLLPDKRIIFMHLSVEYWLLSFQSLYFFKHFLDLRFLRIRFVMIERQFDKLLVSKEATIDLFWIVQQNSEVLVKLTLTIFCAIINKHEIIFLFDFPVVEGPHQKE